MAGTTSKRLLCEGWIEEGCESAAVCLPEIGYVRQPDGKTWVAFGDRARVLSELAERTDAAEAVALVERYEDLDLEERTLSTGAVVRLPKGGKWIVEGPAQRSDVKNANQRVYPRKIWEKLISDSKSYVQEAIRSRAMIGHLEHPKDGRTDLGEAAILTVSAELREDGTVWNRFEILETPKGLILQELTAKGVRWGVSSRGNGSVDDTGKVNESDYTLKTWDAVAAPSTPGAFVSPGVDDTATNENAQPPVQGQRSGRASASLKALKTLVESDHVGLDPSRRNVLSESLLRVIATLDEQDATALIRGGDWSLVQQAVQRAHELRQDDEIGDRLDAAIDEALVSGEMGEESGLTPVIESLQRQLADSVTEQAELQRRLEAAESGSRELQRVHEDVLEQLSMAREELRIATEQRDLAHELLSEASQAPKADGRVVARVESLIDARPALKPFRDLLCEAATEAQAAELAERLVPSRPKPVETPEPALAHRTSLPVGVVESLDVPPPRPSHATLPRGAELAGAALSGLQKRI